MFSNWIRSLMALAAIVVEWKRENSKAHTYLAYKIFTTDKKTYHKQATNNNKKEKICCKWKRMTLWSSWTIQRVLEYVEFSINWTRRPFLFSEQTLYGSFTSSKYLVVSESLHPTAVSWAEMCSKSRSSFSLSFSVTSFDTFRKEWVRDKNGGGWGGGIFIFTQRLEPVCHKLCNFGLFLLIWTFTQITFFSLDIYSNRFCHLGDYINCQLIMKCISIF